MDAVKQWYLLLQVLVTASSLPPYEYVGCVIDASERALDWHKDVSNQNQTVQRCIHFCDGWNAPYAGLQFSKECFCGHDFDVYGFGEESSCDTSCSGNPQQKCGGVWRMTTYRLLKWKRFRRDPSIHTSQSRTGTRTTWSSYTGIGVLNCAMECSKGKGECWSFFHDDNSGQCYTQNLLTNAAPSFIKSDTFCADC